MEIPPLDPARIYSEVLEAGEDYADKKAAYETRDATTKSVLAQITGRYMDGKTTKAEAERNALASQDYRDHLETVAKARGEFLHAQVKYEALKMLAELRRTQESTRRAEMRL